MKQTFGRLLVEAALIVFSVLFAFWIDDRSQAAEDTALKAELLNKVYDEITTDSLNLSNFQADQDRALRSLLKLIEYVNTGNIKEDSLAALLFNIEWIVKYESSSYTYSSIINSGLLRLFERDEVFMNISRYYRDNENLDRYSGAYYRVAVSDLWPYTNLHFDRRLYEKTPGTPKARIDLQRFTSKEFINILYTLRATLLVQNLYDSHKQNQAIVLSQIRELL